MNTRTREIQDVFETASLGAPEKAVGFVLWRIVHRYMREVDRALVEVGLTHLQFTALALSAWLGRAGDPATQSAIARFGDIHPMQLSQMLKILESKRMIVRARSPADIRAKRVGVTAAGLRSLRRALPLVIEVQQRLFGEQGGPGGSLLTALLQIDGERGGEAQE